MYLYNKICKNNFFHRERKISIILRKCHIERISFINKFFYNTEFFKTHFYQTSFKNCKFKKTIFNNVELDKTKFFNCSFNNVEFSHFEIKNEIFKNCKFNNIKFNCAILNYKNKLLKSITSKNKNDIIYKDKNGDLIHNKKMFQFLKKEKNANNKNKYYFNSHIISRNNNDKIFKKCDYTYKLKKIYSGNNKATIINNLINGNGVIKAKPNFNKMVIDKAKRLVFKKTKYKINNNLDKRKLVTEVPNLYSIDPVFLRLLPPKYVLDVIAKLLGENYYSGLYSSQIFLPGARSMAYHIDYPYTTMPKDQNAVIKNFSHKHPMNIQSLLFLTNVDHVNGPTYIIPGTQMLQLEIKSKKIFMNTDQTKIVFKHKKKWHKYRVFPLTGKKGTMHIFNGLAWHGVGDNMSYSKHRISANNQFIPNFIRPMHDNTIQERNSHLVSRIGFEPMTPSLKGKCSTN